MNRIAAVARRLGAPSPRRARARRPVGELYDAWERAYEARGEDVVLEVGRAIRVDELGAYGFSALTAPRALDGLRVTARLYGLVTGDGRWRVDERPDRVALVLERPSATRLGRRVSDEAAIAQFYACLGQAASVRPRVRELLVRDRAVAPAALERLTGARPRRGREDAIVLDRASLEAPCVRAHAGMHAYFVADAEREEAALRAPSWTARARTAIAEAIDADRLGGARVARTLGVSFRTLQRRLRDEGASYQALADDVRRELAVALLGDGLSVERVAERVGYAEPGAFHRAFVKWTGVAPGAYTSPTARASALAPRT